MGVDQIRVNKFQLGMWLEETVCLTSVDSLGLGGIYSQFLLPRAGKTVGGF
jgi:hypothetical protein